MTSFRTIIIHCGKTDIKDEKSMGSMSRNTGQSLGNSWDHRVEFGQNTEDSSLHVQWSSDGQSSLHPRKCQCDGCLVTGVVKGDP